LEELRNEIEALRNEVDALRNEVESLTNEVEEGRGKIIAEFIAYCTWGEKAFWYTMGIKEIVDSGWL
jgi:hypothetical protein